MEPAHAALSPSVGPFDDVNLCDIFSLPPADLCILSASVVESASVCR